MTVVLEMGLSFWGMGWDRKDTDHISTKSAKTGVVIIALISEAKEKKKQQGKRKLECS